MKATAGSQSLERCAQAFTVAATATASATSVSLWLAGEASWFALPGEAERVELPDSAFLVDKLAVVLARGKVTLCATCAARRDITPGVVRAGVRVAGPAVFVEECLTPGALAMVY